MSDQSAQDMHNTAPDQGAQGMFNAPVTINHGDPRQQRQY
jgi:hypothetical protein